MRKNKLYIIEAGTADLKEWKILSFFHDEPNEKFFKMFRKHYPEYEFFHLVEFTRNKIIRS